MLAADRDALVCDLAETYHILNMAALPVALLATLAAGLRDDSRIRMRMAEVTVTQRELLAAAMLDRLTTLCWMQSRDGAHGQNRPLSVLEAICGKDNTESPRAARPVAFDSPEDFERAWAELSQKKER